MPEFILDLGLDYDRFNKLDAFTKAYVEAMFWTETSDDSDDCAGTTFAELSNESLTEIVETCRDFQDSFKELLDRAYDLGAAQGHYDESRAGHDFWLTRNGHGAGFWDRGLGEVGNKLSEMSKPYGEVNLYRGDDGKLYL